MRQRLLRGLAVALTLCGSGPAPAAGNDANSAAPTVEVPADAAAVDLRNAIRLYIDRSGTLDIGEVSAPAFAANFAAPAGDVSNLGHEYAPVWVRFTLRGPAGARSDALLELPYAFADYLTLYRPRGDGGFDISRSGDHTRASERELSDRLFVFPLPPTPTPEATYYLRYQNSGLLSLPLAVWNEAAFREARANQSLLLGAYFGCMLTLLVYNLALYAGTRLTVYSAYVLYTAAMIFFMFTQNGLSGAYLWPESPALADRLNYLSILFAATGVAYFGREYLESRTQTPRLDRVLRTATMVGVALMATNFVLPRMAAFWSMLGFAALMLVLIYGTALRYGLVLRTRAGAYFAVALTLPVVGASFMVLRNAGLYPVNWITEHGMQVGTMLEMIVLSLGLANRVAELSRERESAERRAHVDALTGLANRAQLALHLPHALRRARARQHKLAVLCVDLDRFKPINDNHGHAAGDSVLTEVARRMRDAVRTHDMVARAGGDEFIVVADALESETQAIALAQRLNAAIAEPIHHGESPLRVSASIGIAIYPHHADDESSLLRLADEAMYRAKAMGRDAFAMAA